MAPPKNQVQNPGAGGIALSRGPALEGRPVYRQTPRLTLWRGKGIVQSFENSNFRHRRTWCHAQNIFFSFRGGDQRVRTTAKKQGGPNY
jgi:hypothetical protein